MYIESGIESQKPHCFELSEAPDAKNLKDIYADFNEGDLVSYGATFYAKNVIRILLSPRSFYATHRCRNQFLYECWFALIVKLYCYTERLKPLIIQNRLQPASAAFLGRENNRQLYKQLLAEEKSVTAPAADECLLVSREQHQVTNFNENVHVESKYFGLEWKGFTSQAIEIILQRSWRLFFASTHFPTYLPFLESLVDLDFSL